MTDNEKDKEVTPSRGADWEVVQLTASTYAASPSPPKLDHDESSNTLFMSDHFVFPPSEHENLPIEPDYSDIHEEEDDPHDIIDEARKLVSTSPVPDMEFEDNSVSYIDDSPLKYSKSSDEDKYEESSIPSEVWWRRHASSLYRHAREANPLWSIVVAATLTGLVIMGKRWHAFELKQLRVSDEKLSRALAPINRLKDVVIRSHQTTSSFIGAAVASSR